MKHTMDFVKFFDDGSFLLSCPECGRSFRLRTSPYSKTVLVKGNDAVLHSGNIGGVFVSDASVTSRLSPYDAFVEGLYFDD